MIALFVGLAVLAVLGPRGRRAGGLGRRGVGVVGAVRASGVGRARAGGRWFGRRRLGGAAGRPRDLSVVVVEVASLLRAGADPTTAWAGVLGGPVGGEGWPAVEDLEALRGGGAGAGGRDGARAQAGAVMAASELARTLGAPLAQVLDRVAGGLAADAEAAGERRAALAGPRATARVLTGLPVLGAVLGAAVGADPVGVLLGGGFGTLALALGAGLIVVGRWWISRLVRVAARAGTDG